MDQNLDYYRLHGIMTDISTMKEMVKDIPKDIKSIVNYVQNILVHQHWSSSYGVELDERRKREPWIRSFEEKLKFLKNKGFDHVSNRKTNEKKMIGICRDYAVIAAALCREAEIPARARCGFATYFEKGKNIDHWILEYWNEEMSRWVLVDPQLDLFQMKSLNISFDPFNLSKDEFINAPMAWKMCRNGDANPKHFGIFQWWGYDYLKCNLLLDANSLLKVPMQPWDGWNGYKNKPIEEWTEEDYGKMDHLATLALKVNENFNSFKLFIEHDDQIKVPSNLEEVVNYLE